MTDGGRVTQTPATISEDQAVDDEPAGRITTKGLRARLVLSDALGLGLGAVLCALVSGTSVGNGDGPAIAAAATGAVALGLGLARWQLLYRTSRSSVRSAELAAIVRVAAVLALSSLALDELLDVRPDLWRAGALFALVTTTFSLSRSLFRAWLRARRAQGYYVRPVVMVGANADTTRIMHVLADHRDSGYAVAGVCCDVEDSTRTGLRHQWLGDVDHAATMVREGIVTGAVVVASALDTEVLNRVVREVTCAGGHVHISTGVHGLDSQRIASEPIAHEPLLHIHPTTLDPRQVVLKRVLDVSISAVLLVATAPVLLVAALATRLADRGPALFRQVRVGRDGELFEVLKLRTMEVGAEDRIDELASANRRNGPLFKVDDDPRVTRLGHFLRSTSIDELPQLWNVLRGDMSLVGPRPALPAEVRDFPATLAKRTNVPPGVTGLWQVEARDNPSFDAYARLDMFYVDNWTITFDLVILLATVESEIARALGALFRRSAAEIVIDILPDEESAETAPVRPRTAPLTSTRSSTLID